MSKMTPIAAFAAAALSTVLLTATPGQATPLGATADARLAADNVGLVTNVVWGWGTTGSIIGRSSTIGRSSSTDGTSLRDARSLFTGSTAAGGADAEARRAAIQPSRWTAEQRRLHRLIRKGDA